MHTWFVDDKTAPASFTNQLVDAMMFADLHTTSEVLKTSIKKRTRALILDELK